MNRETDYEAFAKLWTWLTSLYPSASVSEVGCDGYWSLLEPYPLEAVRKAIQIAARQNKEFIPTAPAVAFIAESEAGKLRNRERETRHDRLLSAPPAQNQDRQSVLSNFYSLCDRAARNLSGCDVVNEQNESEIEGLLVVLARCYLPNVEEYVATMVWPTVNHFAWRKYAPSAVANGLRKAPLVCRKHPSLLMLDELIRGQPLIGWPEDWVDLEAAKKMYSDRERHQSTSGEGQVKQFVRDVCNGASVYDSMDRAREGAA